MTTIKRDDAIYLEIEQFEDYELTNNIAFEMAIRNDEIVGEIVKSIEVNTFDSKDNLRQYGFSTTFDGLYLQKSLNLSVEQRERLKNKDKNIQKRLKIHGETRSTVDGENVKFVSAIDRGELGRVRLKVGKTNKDFEVFINNNPVLKKYLEVFKRDGLEAKKTPKWLKMIIKDTDVSSILDVEIKHISPISRAKFASNIWATVNMKRPQMIIQRTAKIVHTSFNMALEIEELKAQIEIIKKEFDNNFNDIKSTAEHFNIELEKADILICNSNGKCIDPRGYLTKQQKMADLFFIYDCLKAGIIKTTIKHQIYEYHLKNEVEKPLDDKTLYKYRDIAIKYIDHFGYKELLTGVKSI